jgi:hypothetical protein
MKLIVITGGTPLTFEIDIEDTDTLELIINSNGKVTSISKSMSRSELIYREPYTI